MKPWIAVAFAVSIALIGGVWLIANRSQLNKRTDQSQTASPEPALVHSSTQFAFNLLKELTRPDNPTSQQRPATGQQPSPNRVFSPLSVQLVLALFLNGAAGQTREEIA